MEAALVGVGTGVMKPLLSKLYKALKEEHSKLKGVRRQVEDTKDEMSSMEAALEALADAEHLNPETRAWRDDVRELSYDMEDCVDDFMARVDHEHDGSTGLKKLFRKLKKLKPHHQIAGEMEKLKARAIEASERHKRYKINCPTPDSEIDPRVHALYVDVGKLVGIEGPKKHIIEWFKNEDASTQLRVVSIVGPGGLGKTTLANAVFETIQSEFSCAAFVPISRKPIMINVLRDIAERLGVDHNPSNDNVPLVIKRLRDHLGDKKYLIVIDDIWSTEDWEFIKDALLDNGHGSRIITSTRNSDVASCCSQGDYVYSMKPLGFHDSKRLFLKRAFHSEDLLPPNLERVSTQILEKCAGLPLAIITISSLLAHKIAEDEWERVLYAIGSSLAKEAGDMSKIISLSYFDLSHPMRTCLLYLSAYPEDHIIEKRSLIHKWIAEGFIHEGQGTSAYEVGESYFNNFINRSLIQPSFSMGVTDPLLSKFSELLEEEHARLKGVRMRRVMESTRDEMRSMKAALEALADAKQLDPELIVWREQARQLSKDMEDFLDKFMFHADHKQDERKGMKGFINKTKNVLKNIKFHIDMASEIKELKARAIEASKRHKRYKLEQHRHASNEITGQVMACRVHDIILDFIRCKAREENFMISFGDAEQGKKHKVRRLSYQTGNDEMATVAVDFSHVRSLAIFGRFGQNSVLDFPFLRVLDLGDCRGLGNDHLASIEKLFLLKHLRLGSDSNSITELPGGIGKLKFLETLDMRGARVGKLPSSMARLQRLARLYAIFEPTCLSDGIIGQLQSLEELEDVEVGSELDKFLQQVGQLTKLRTLSVTLPEEYLGCEMVDAANFTGTLVSSCSIHQIARFIGTLISSCNLHDLTITKKGTHTIKNLLSLDSCCLANPAAFRKICIHLYLVDKVPNWMTSLVNLRVLYLSIYRTRPEDITILGEMPALISLKLRTYHGRNGKIFIQRFRSLKYFYLEILYCGTALEFKEGSMPKLEKLELIFKAHEMGCLNYTSDFGIQHLSALTKVDVYIMGDKGIRGKIRGLIATALGKLRNPPTLSLDGDRGVCEYFETATKTMYEKEAGSSHQNIEKDALCSYLGRIVEEINQDPVPRLRMLSRSLDDLVESLCAAGPSATAESAAVARAFSEIQREIRSGSADDPIKAAANQHVSALVRDLLASPAAAAAPEDLVIHRAQDLLPHLAGGIPSAIAEAARILADWPSAAFPVLFKPLAACLASPDLQASTVAAAAFCELSAPPADAAPFLPLVPKLYNLLTTSRSDRALADVLRVLTRLAPLESSLAAQITEPVCQLLARSSDKSLTLECIRTVLAVLPAHGAAVSLAIEKAKELLAAANISDPEFANEIIWAVLAAGSRNVYELMRDFDCYVSLLADMSMSRSLRCAQGAEIARQLVQLKRLYEDKASSSHQSIQEDALRSDLGRIVQKINHILGKGDEEEENAKDDVHVDLISDKDDDDDSLVHKNKVGKNKTGEEEGMHSGVLGGNVEADASTAFTFAAVSHEFDHLQFSVGDAGSDIRKDTTRVLDSAAKDEEENMHSSKLAGKSATTTTTQATCEPFTVPSNAMLGGNSKGTDTSALDAPHPGLLKGRVRQYDTQRSFP